MFQFLLHFAAPACQGLATGYDLFVSSVVVFRSLEFSQAVPLIRSACWCSRFIAPNLDNPLVLSRNNAEKRDQNNLA
jgi:hypothetical protein